MVRRMVASILAVCFVLSIVGYAAGLLTGEIRQEDSCVLCRAIRFKGARYGFGYEYVEDVAMTGWYRKNIDPQHGLDSQHPHSWEQSACTVVVKPGISGMDYACTWVSPVFLLRPEIEMMALQQIPDKATQVALIHALNSSSRKANTRRIRLLIEYYHIDSRDMTWADWWRKHANEFELTPSMVTPGLPARL